MAEAVAHDAARGGHSEPDCLEVATVDEDGAPDVRPVLMKFFAPGGPGFISDRGSAKARQIAADPRVAATLRWTDLFRVIRFRGVAQELGPQELQGYWQTRPWGSQVSAWASLQSTPISGRPELEQRYADQAARFTGPAGRSSRCRCRRPSVVGGSAASRWSCGRGAPRGCTTGSSTSGWETATWTTPRPGAAPG